jgi:hypothetical protein
MPTQADKAMLYASYAETCLKAAPVLPDREARVVHREMAAEWFRLAEQAATSDMARGKPNKKQGSGEMTA